MVKVEYDPNKNQRNIEQRGLSFEMVKNFEFDTALVWKDDRQDYGEIRYCALGYIGLCLHQLVFTFRNNSIRVISLRKANKREVNRYAQN
ncbi:MAG: hypothetical protein CSA20_09455 [Deltaproteobacteria bacterium]|nr:MAG: hypothetical protein CSA20_09455 [Deltaproteobacteria bacterium]